MNKVVLSFFLMMSLLIIAFGIYLTVVSREDITKKTVPDWVTNHVKTLKIVGPILIGVGVLGLGSSALLLSQEMGSSLMTENNNFGFKFY
jgi:mannose/fructose/N-acetylgalactosamine-specific phosphotransferase system component IIC